MACNAISISENRKGRRMTDPGRICRACGHREEEHGSVGCIEITATDALGYAKETCGCPRFEGASSEGRNDAR